MPNTKTIVIVGAATLAVLAYLRRINGVLYAV